MLPAFIFSLVLIIALLWVIIHSDGSKLLKLVFITLSIYLSASVLTSAENFKGWPTVNELPNNFQVHWTTVKEPNKADKKPGAIYLWVSPIEFQSNCAAILLCLEEVDTKQPRAYKLTYSVEAHKASEDMNDKIKKGLILIGKNIKDKEMVEPNRDRELFLEEFKIYELPPISGLPEK